MTWDEFARVTDEMGVALNGDQIAAFEVFEERLYKANETKNLTRVPREDCRPRHFLDSIALSPLVPKGSSVIDIGTGAGFPGVPLAIARPDLKVTLLDAATKEVQFLESLSDIATFGLILHRGEIAARDKHFREQYDVAVGRALAPLAIQAEISAPFVRVGGSFLPQRTAGEETPEYWELGLELFERNVYQIGSITRLIPIYRKIDATPSRFPRVWASMKRQPLV